MPVPKNLPTPNTELTTAQKTCLRAVDKLWRCLGGPPTVRQLAEELGISNPATHRLCVALRDKGCLGQGMVRVPTLMRITPKGRKAL